MCEVNSTLKLLEDLYSKYLQVSDEMKVKLLKTLLSNCTLKDGKVSYTYKKPFCYIAETDCFEKISPRVDGSRTVILNVCQNVKYFYKFCKL